MVGRLEWRERWREAGQTWKVRLETAGLGGIAEAFREALNPLTPLAVQLLWLVQPGFAMLGQPELITGLSDLLEENVSAARPAQGADR